MELVRAPFDTPSQPPVLPDHLAEPSLLPKGQPDLKLLLHYELPAPHDALHPLSQLCRYRVCTH